MKNKIFNLIKIIFVSFLWVVFYVLAVFWMIYIFNQYLGFSGNEATIFYNEANKSYTLYQNFSFTFYLYLTLAFFVIILNIYIMIKLLRELKRKKEIKKI